MLVVRLTQRIVFLLSLQFLTSRIITCRGRWRLDRGSVFALGLSRVFRDLFLFLLKVWSVELM